VSAARKSAGHASPSHRSAGHASPGRRSAVPIRPRTAVAVALASVIGLLAFTWPLLVPTGSVLAQAGNAPWLFVVLLPLVLAIVLAGVSEDGIDARAVAVLGVLAAVGAALRPLGAGTAGIEPVFVLLVPAGRVFGRGFGFVLGAVTLLASALLTGGVGPWLPFQMLGAAWIGLGAGCLPALRGRAEVVLLAAYATVAGLVFGFLMDLTVWPFLTGVGTLTGAGALTGAGPWGGAGPAGAGPSGLSFVPGAPLTDNLAAFARFAIATSLGWDVLRGVTLAVVTLLTGRAVLLALRRTARRAAFDPPVIDVPGVRVLEVEAPEISPGRMRPPPGL